MDTIIFILAVLIILLLLFVITLDVISRNKAKKLWKEREQMLNEAARIIIEDNKRWKNGK